MLTGLDRLASLPDLVARLRRERVGLLAHPASVTRGLEHVSSVLARLGITPRVVFGPEHGWAGHAQDMIGVAGGEEDAGARVVSLYGDAFSDLTPRREDLEGLDVVLVDLQDVGARYYTFIWTAVLVTRACRDAGVRVVVLDRPNPLGAQAIEGKLQKPGFLSFVGLEPLPVRHALTLGEVVAHRATAAGEADHVTIVSAEGLAPEAHASAWDRPFVMPSPNMPTYETALVYPGGCLLEGTNLSDGRGTTRPFELTGAPYLDGRALAERLGEARLPGFVARPVSFEPTFHKHAKTSCGGVQIHVTDVAAFRPYATYLALVTAAHHLAPSDFRFRTERYEFVDDIPAFDLLTGSAEARERILAGESPRDVAEALAPAGLQEHEVVAEARAARARVTTL